MRFAWVWLIVFLMAMSPLGAQQPDDLHEKIRAATLKVKSFRMQMWSSAGMTSVSTVITHPLQMHMQMASGPVTMEMYIVDGYLYQRIANGGWKKQKLPAMHSSPVDALGAASQAANLVRGPDVQEGDKDYGSYRIEVTTAVIPGAPAAPPLALTCTYDKVTYLLHECKNPLITETFQAYNDPGNTIVIPAELSKAADAGELPIPVAPSPIPT